MASRGRAQWAGRGNANASRLGERIAGCGGFINSRQGSKQVGFVGTFTTGGLEVSIGDGALTIEKEGRFSKFVATVDQMTFSGDLAAEEGREGYFVTERCVFRLGPGGLALVEIAPGVDLDGDILAKLPFEPTIENPRPMDAALFRPERLDLRKRFLDIHIEDRLSYDPGSNTVLMDFAGMRVRSA